MPARDPIALLLAGQYPDPTTGELLAAESRAVVIETSLAGSEADLVAGLGVGTHVTVISDRNTHAVLGARVERALSSRFAMQSLVLDAGPRADDATVERVLAALSPSTDLVVAVGSGTLNDLTKMVAFRRGVPQVIFATAPSMNGYTSLSASITTAGIKTSFRTRTPLGVYFDLRVLAAAPARLIRAGLGDSACRSTAQADWLLSHLLLDRPYRETPFALLADDERDLFGDTRALLAGDLEQMRHLVRTLVLSGFGMTICDGSYPASQGEHLLSHYVDMMRPSDTLHGEQIAVCTVAMATLQEQLLARDTPPLLRPSSLRHEDLVRHYGPVIGDACWREFEQKHFDRETTDALNMKLARDWDTMRERIRAVSVGATKLRSLLAAAGAPVEPVELGWSAVVMQHALEHAREIRNRYTFLDLVADSASAR
ncbi:MAG TPA: iron-containing alcohol dehydrogenase [Kofleriaceae bacterium]|nr:iron-containing alcohol dehydrogenase [Kofleriaceae bacterium]